VKIVLSCSDCLARHSEYADGVMDAETANEFRAHLSTCPRCARYDHVLRHGVGLLNERPRAELADDFLLRLNNRLTIEDQRAQMRPVTSMAAGSLAVAAMLAFAAWIPVLMLSQENSTASIAVQPISAAATEIAWHRENAVDQRGPTHVHLARRLAWAPTSSGHVIEAKYTPVVFESPISPPSYARPVSYAGE
jgi:anti-sigma factor RsiW